MDGVPALRAALSAEFRRENGLDYPPEQIVVANGTKPLLPAAPMAMTDPEGKVIETDAVFVHGLIEHGGVAVVPGSAFGLSPFFRLCYAVDTGQLRLAMARIRRFCKELR